MFDHYIDNIFAYGAVWIGMQAAALTTMRGLWRILAIVPLIPMGLAMLLVFLASGSGGNVTPVIPILLLPLALLWMAALWLAFGITRIVRGR